MAALRDCVDNLGWTYSLIAHGTILRLPKHVHDLLLDMGCQRGGGNKTIPSCIKGKEHWRNFLNGMFDRHFNKSGLIITCENLNAARHIQTALLGFRVLSRLSVRGGFGSGYISITGKDAERYCDEIGFSEQSKYYKLQGLCVGSDLSARGKADIIPLDIELISKARNAIDWRKSSVEFRHRIASNLCEGHALARRDYLTLCSIAGEYPVLAQWAWSRVKSVSKVEKLDMVDFDVPDGEAFMASVS